MMHSLLEAEVMGEVLYHCDYYCTIINCMILILLMIMEVLS